MTSTRRFTWFDASVLVMAAMLATAEVRHRVPDMWLRLEHLTRVPMGAFEKWTWVVDYLGRAFVYQFLTAFTVATLLLRLIKPHPPVRRLFRQPGTVALIGAVTGIIVTLLVRTGPTLHHLKYNLVTALAFDETLMSSWGWCGRLAGFSVATSWITLALSGRCRTEPSWIDRLGRALGVVWISSLAVWIAYSCAGFRDYD